MIAAMRFILGLWCQVTGFIFVAITVSFLLSFACLTASYGLWPCPPPDRFGFVLAIFLTGLALQAHALAAVLHVSLLASRFSLHCSIIDLDFCASQ
jgi:hypothetical protein